MGRTEAMILVKIGISGFDNNDFPLFWTNCIKSQILFIFRFYRLLNPEFNGLFDNYRRCYADILYRWGLLEARVTVSLWEFSFCNIHILRTSLFCAMTF